MFRHSAHWLVVVSLSAGCVQYNTRQNTASVNVAATVTNVNVTDPPETGAVLTSVPDIPSVAGARVDVNTIRTALDPYGNWIDDGTYGVVWVPSEASVGAEFVPYGSNGNWVPTDQGWYWQSHYQWGWLPFHYGRWVRVRELWAWVPGSLFAPAWVDWRMSNEYVGWAPLPPQGAEFMAPYAFCRYGEIIEYDVWTRVVYGSESMMLYSESVSIRAQYGVGGAYYAWGPTLAQTGCSTAQVVPINQAWGTETGGARGGNSGGVRVTPSSGGVATGGTPTGGTPTGGMATRPPLTPGAPGTGPGQPGGPGVAAQNPPRIALAPTTPPVVTPPGGPTAIAPPRVAVHPAEVAFNPAVYRPRDTVVIRDSVPYSPPRSTVSLGTTENYGSPGGYRPPAPVAYSPPSTGYVAPSAPVYSPPSTAAYSPPRTVYTPPSTPAYQPSTPSYSPPSAYSHPGYVAPSTPSYSTPTYSAPHVNYGAPSVAHTSAPSAPVSYHPSFRH